MENSHLLSHPELTFFLSIFSLFLPHFEILPNGMDNIIQATPPSTLTCPASSAGPSCWSGSWRWPAGSSWVVSSPGRPAPLRPRPWPPSFFWKWRRLMWDAASTLVSPGCGHGCGGTWGTRTRTVNIRRNVGCSDMGSMLFSFEQVNSAREFQCLNQKHLHGK